VSVGFLDFRGSFSVAAVFLIGISLASGCRLLSSASEVNARQASSLKPKINPCYLALSSGVQCQMGARACERALVIMSEVKKRPVNLQRDILADEFVQKMSQSKVDSVTQCDKEIEDWTIASFAAGKRAAYEVAGIGIPGLQELKLLIWGGGMAAGFLGDGVGAACMSAISAGISYAESKRWIRCGR